jgi:hypothetical protein
MIIGMFVIWENGHVSHGKAEKPEREILCVCRI